MATEATVSSGRYVRAIGGLDGGAEVIQVACPAGRVHPGGRRGQPRDRRRRAQFHGGAEGGRPDVVIMGCTHYPLIAPMLQRHLGRDVTLVNPAAEIAREAAEVLVRQDIECDAERRAPTGSTAPARPSVSRRGRPLSADAVRRRRADRALSVWPRWSTVTTRLLARGSLYAAAYVVLTLTRRRLRPRLGPGAVPYLRGPAALRLRRSGRRRWPHGRHRASPTSGPALLGFARRRLRFAVHPGGGAHHVASRAARGSLGGAGGRQRVRRRRRARADPAPAVRPSVGFVALGEAVVLFSGGLVVLSLIRTHGALFGLAPRNRSGRRALSRPQKR